MNEDLNKFLIFFESKKLLEQETSEAFVGEFQKVLQLADQLNNALVVKYITVDELTYHRFKVEFEQLQQWNQIKEASETLAQEFRLHQVGLSGGWLLDQAYLNQLSLLLIRYQEWLKVYPRTREKWQEMPRVLRHQLLAQIEQNNESLLNSIINIFTQGKVLGNFCEILQIIFSRVDKILTWVPFLAFFQSLKEIIGDLLRQSQALKEIDIFLNEVEILGNQTNEQVFERELEKKLQEAERINQRKHALNLDQSILNQFEKACKRLQRWQKQKKKLADLRSQLRAYLFILIPDCESINKHRNIASLRSFRFNYVERLIEDYQIFMIETKRGYPLILRNQVNQIKREYDNGFKTIVTALTQDLTETATISEALIDSLQEIVDQLNRKSEQQTEKTLRPSSFPYPASFKLLSNALSEKLYQFRQWKEIWETLEFLESQLPESYPFSLSNFMRAYLHFIRVYPKWLDGKIPVCLRSQIGYIKDYYKISFALVKSHLAEDVFKQKFKDISSFFALLEKNPKLDILEGNIQYRFSEEERRENDRSENTKRNLDCYELRILTLNQKKQSLKEMRSGLAIYKDLMAVDQTRSPISIKYKIAKLENDLKRIFLTTTMSYQKKSVLGSPVGEEASAFGQLNQALNPDSEFHFEQLISKSSWLDWLYYRVIDKTGVSIHTRLQTTAQKIKLQREYQLIKSQISERPINRRALQFLDETIALMLQVLNVCRPIRQTTEFNILSHTLFEIESIYTGTNLRVVEDILGALEKLKSLLKTKRWDAWLDHNETFLGFFGVQGKLVGCYDKLLNDLSVKTESFKIEFGHEFIKHPVIKDSESTQDVEPLKLSEKSFGFYQRLPCSRKQINLTSVEETRTPILLDNSRPVAVNKKLKEIIFLPDGQYFCGMVNEAGQPIKGILNDSRGNKVYEGDFVEGLYEGRGTLYEGGKVVYTGPFSKGLFSGKFGVLYNENGERIAQGPFLNGKLHGDRCKEYDPKTGQLIYKGSMQKGLREGKGVSYDASGKIKFEGPFLNGKLHGDRCKEYDPKTGQLIYKGSMQKGLREGKGVSYDASGKIKFEGPFLNGKLHGDGCKEYDSETGQLIYKGSMQEGLREGNGCEEYDLETGYLLYQGPMKAGVRNGEGTEYKTIEGNHREFGVVYENGKLQRATFRYPDGSKFEGEFKENKRYKGILYDKEDYPVFKGIFGEKGEFRDGIYYSFKQEGSRKYIQAEEFHIGVKITKYFYLKDLKNNFKKFIENALNQQSWSKKLKYIAEWSQITEIPVSAWKACIPNVYAFLDKKISSFLESTFCKEKNIEFKEIFSKQQFLHLVSQIGCPVFQRASIAWVPEDTFIINSDAVDHSSALNSLSLFRDENLKKLFYQIQEQAYKKLTEIIVKDIKELNLLDIYKITQRRVGSLAIFDIGINKMVQKLDNAGKKKLEEILLEIQKIYQALDSENLDSSLKQLKACMVSQCQELERNQQKILKKIFGSQNKLISCYKQAVQNLSGSIDKLATQNRSIVGLQQEAQEEEKAYSPSGSRDHTRKNKDQFESVLYYKYKTNKSPSNSRRSSLSFVETFNQTDRTDFNEKEESHNPQHRTLEYPPSGGAPKNTPLS